MTKRKRESHNAEPADVGLGATLAHLRGEDRLDKATEAGAANDGDGWTVVGPKRRRKQQGSESRNSPSGSHAQSSARHRRSASNDARSDTSEGSEDRHPSLADQARLFNPFAPETRDGERLSPPENPFSTRTSGADTTTMSREERRKERKLERNYPAIEHSHQARLQSHVKIMDLQSLILYLLANGTAPQWVSVRNRSGIQRVVMLLVPGLDLDMFSGRVALDSTPLPSSAADEEADDGRLDGPATAVDRAKAKRLHISPDDFYPATLKPSRLPTVLKPLADMFKHVWPIKAPGDHRQNQYFKLHSPIHTMLTAQIPKTQEQKQMKKKGNHKGPMPQDSKHWQNKRTPVTEYVASLTEQQENEFVPHPAMFTTTESKEAAYQRRVAAKQSTNDGWVDTIVTNLGDGEMPDVDVEKGSITAGRRVISVDCEMCKAENDEFVLTRVSLLDWDGTVILDKLVKPEVTIKDYLTQWSGITAAMLEDVTITLADIQQELLKIITPHTILVGHSLNSDLNALKLTHPFVIDTGMLYPHPRGPPYKQALKWLANKYLHREVQKGSDGHNSVEDAQTCLDLLKQKCEKGPAWGTGETNAESIFKRLGRSSRPKSNNEIRAGAVIDWGEPNRGHGNHAKISIGCKGDDEIVEAIDRTLKGNATGREGVTEDVDFVWARLRELELARGWWDDTKTADVEAIRQSALQRLGLLKEESVEHIEVEGSALGEAVSRTVSHITQVYESLPRCTAFIVYSGTGDPREIRRLQSMQQQYRREYQTKNWDNLSVKWTDTEIQALSRACQKARNGVAFIGVK